MRKVEFGDSVLLLERVFVEKLHVFAVFGLTDTHEGKWFQFTFFVGFELNSLNFGN
jgi:hypothetical protein